MTVLMAGCGDLGTEIGQRFADLGHRVVGLRRTPERLPAAIEGLLADELGVAPPAISPDEHAGSRGKRCDSSRLLATGFRLTYPTYREGYRVILAGHGIRHP
ncbi:hypothetical protein DFQ14_10959 [Halopolyspora algeriensis]|uniref:Short subunit dehydrogenase n=1 Tax=Halopolyspora algeriensis TaxID=1500506 RepID=A0A368VJP0_9ACTN|nr:hypothetical protein DFQ14_10959 [Halopolyspora algeriensis]TQM53934.1 hypothetical protein FHU43_2109 [Halopolyspora algeriensis]